MDYFKGIANEEFIKDFIEELYSVTEFTHVLEEDDNDLDPYPDSEYGKHITAVQDNLKKRLFALLSEQNLPEEEKEKIAVEKLQELFAVLLPKIDEYELQIKVNYGQ